MLDTEPLRIALEQATGDLKGRRTVGEATVHPINEAARYVAQNLDEREEILAQFSPSLWSYFAQLWPLVADALDPSADGGPVHLAVAMGKLERNMLAGSLSAQKEAIASEPDIRRLIFNATTFTRIEDPEYAELHGILAQLLCNLVSSRGGDESEAIADGVLDTWLSGRREDDVLIRLLESRDAPAISGVLRLLLNLATPRRLPRLLSPVALRWLSQILGRMDDWHATAETLFDLAVSLISRFFHGLQGDLYAVLSVSDEVVTPSQVTLLKLLDAFLTRPHANSRPCPNAFVLSAWRGTAAYAAASMRSGQDDARLPSVLAALVLETEILSAMALGVQARADARAKHGEEEGKEGGEEDMVAEMKGRLPSSPDGSGASASPVDIIPQLVDVLRATNDFLPRIKPTPTTAAENATLASGQPLTQNEIEHAFANVKRDLVRLLGVLAFNDVPVGDAVRAAGGVELVLSLCETDERNAYLREHALFAVRNLMMGNPENQAVIAKMEPLGVVGEDGVLEPLPEKLRKSDAAARSAGRESR